MSKMLYSKGEVIINLPSRYFQIMWDRGVRIFWSLGNDNYEISLSLRTLWLGKDRLRAKLNKATIIINPLTNRGTIAFDKPDTTHDNKD